MRSHRVVVTPPSFDHDRGLLEGIEDFAIEQFVAQLAVERFHITVLPWAAGLDVSGPGADRSDPIPKRLSDELRSIVRSYVCRDSPQDEEIGEGVDDVCGLELPRHPDRQALAGELVDDTQHSERLAIMGAIRDEVV